MSDGPQRFGHSGGDSGKILILNLVSYFRFFLLQSGLWNFLQEFAKTGIKIVDWDL